MWSVFVRATVRRVAASVAIAVAVATPVAAQVTFSNDAVEEIQPSAEFNYLKDEARKSWDGALARGKQFGYRNAQVTVLAPTGTNRNR